MGLAPERISSAIRISWGPRTSIEEIEKALEDLLNTARGLVF